MSLATVHDKKGWFGTPKGPPAEATMRAIALTAVAAMHRSGLVTTQSDTDNPLADVGTTAINDVSGAMMRNLSRSPWWLDD